MTIYDINNRIRNAVNVAHSVSGKRPEELIIALQLWRFIEEHYKENTFTVEIKINEACDPEYMGLIVRRVLTVDENYLRVNMTLI